MDGGRPNEDRSAGRDSSHLRVPGGSAVCGGDLRRTGAEGGRSAHDGVRRKTPARNNTWRSAREAGCGWTADEEVWLTTQYAAGAPLEAIVSGLPGRSGSAVRNKITFLGLKRRRRVREKLRRPGYVQQLHMALEVCQLIAEGKNDRARERAVRLLELRELPVWGKAIG